MYGGVTNNFDMEFRQLVRSRLQGEEGLPIGFIARRASEVFLIFRGTMTTKEWIRDFSIHLTPYPHRTSGRVHDGFIQTYDVFRQSIRDGLGRVGAGKRLFISGHSLGAGLATLAAPDIASTMGFTPAAIYTFASPRVGDRAFADDYNRSFSTRSFRISNTCDIVTAMPFPVPFLGFLGGYFTHVETPVDFTLQTEDVEKNHLMDTYREALTADTTRGRLLRTLFARAAPI
jgi:triacylglycerol lipase